MASTEALPSLYNTLSTPTRNPAAEGSQGQGAGNIAEAESSGLTPLMGFLGLEQRQLGSPIKFEEKSVRHKKGKKGKKQKPASSTPSSMDDMEIDEPDQPVLATRTEWIGTSQFAVEQNLEIQQKV